MSVNADVLVTFSEFLYQTKSIDESAFNFLKSNLNSERNEKVVDLLIEKFPKKTERDFLLYLLKRYNNFHQTKLDKINPLCIHKLSAEFVKNNHVVVFDIIDDEYHIAMVNPLSFEALDETALLLRSPIKVFLTRRDFFENALLSNFRQLDLLNDISKQSSTFTHSLYSNIGLVDSGKLIEPSSIGKILSLILEDAVRLNTSDIHIEADKNKVIVRYRILGNLIKQTELSVEIKNNLVRHILSRSDGNISEMQKPQDTAFPHQLSSGSRINVRVSVINSIDGYSIVMRLLRDQMFARLEECVTSPELLEALYAFMTEGNGMFIVTGPTSSGKTTMMYNLIHEMTVNKYAARKVMTIEDPVEVVLSGVTQVQVNTRIGLDFADIIKVSLRQNPDVLMIGEIRDPVSATMAVRASITGVMVLATLHTRDTTDFALRLHDLGVSLPSISNSLKLIVSTRLIKRLCENCKKESAFTVEQIKFFSSQMRFYKNHLPKIYEAAGCSECRETGYHGLMPIYEFLKINKSQRDALSASNIKAFLDNVNQVLLGKRLLDHAIQLWAQGLTSYHEVSPFIFDNEGIDEFES